MSGGRKHFHNGNTRIFRKRMGYTLKDVAWIFELKNTSQLSRWEKGTSIPSGENMLRMSILYRTLMNGFFADEVVKELKEHLFKREELLKELKKNKGHVGIK